jgi:hypothetical protein
VDEFNVWQRSNGQHRTKDYNPKEWSKLDAATEEAVRREYYESEARDDIVGEGADFDFADTNTGTVDGDVSTTALEIAPRGDNNHGWIENPIHWQWHRTRPQTGFVHPRRPKFK